MAVLAADSLHCTSHSASKAPDERHGGESRVENDKLPVNCIFYSFTFAALAISLTKEKKNSFHNGCIHPTRFPC